MTDRIEYADTVSRKRRVKQVGKEVLFREFRFTDGAFFLVAFGCVFSADIAFWLINTAVELGAAFTFGTVKSSQHLTVKVISYLLLVPAYIIVQVAYFYLFYQRTADGRVCPRKKFFALDWFAVGIFATSLPISFQYIGAWATMVTIFGLTLFAIPEYFEKKMWKDIIRVFGILLGFGVYLYIVYGNQFGLPPVEETLGPLFTYTLSDEFVHRSLRFTNSVIIGPPLIGLFAIFNSVALTSRYISSIPVVRVTVPERHSLVVVFNSAILGTLYYLLVKWVITGKIIILP